MLGTAGSHGTFPVVIYCATLAVSTFLFIVVNLNYHNTHTFFSYIIKLDYENK